MQAINRVAFLFITIITLPLVACNSPLRSIHGISSASSPIEPVQSNACESTKLAPLPPIGAIDTLTYMLAPQAPSFSGFQSAPGNDPDRVGHNTFLTYKFANRDVYEVYHYDDQAIYLRYEVVKPAGWIRTFDELDKKGSGLGALWAPRRVTPGFSTSTSTYAIDRLDKTDNGWSIRNSESLSFAQNMLSFEWTQVDLGNCDVRTLLRMRQEWDGTGSIFEQYDYGADQGILHWEWVERLDYLMSRPAATPGQYVGFHDAGTSFVIEIDSSVTPPRATSINLSDSSRINLPVYAYQSRRTGTNAWYVVTRSFPDDRAPLTQAPRFLIDPAEDMQTGAGTSLVDLPHLHTAPATLNSMNLMSVKF